MCEPVGQGQALAHVTGISSITLRALQFALDRDSHHRVKSLITYITIRFMR